MKSLKLCKNCILYANEDTGRYKKHECMYWGPFCTYKVNSNDGCRHFVGKAAVKSKGRKK